MKTAAKIAAALAECQKRPELVGPAQSYLAVFSHEVRRLMTAGLHAHELCRAVEACRVLFLARLTNLLAPLGLDDSTPADESGL